MSLTTPDGTLENWSAFSGIGTSLTKTLRVWQQDLQRRWMAYVPPVPEPGSYSFSPAASVMWRSAHASAFDLQRFAWERLALARNEGDATPTREALVSMEGIVAHFVADDGPTPQVGSTPSGSIEIQWLAGGTLVSALFDESGEYNLYAVDGDDEVLLDTEVQPGELPSAEVERELAGILATMGTRVTTRPPSWS